MSAFSGMEELLQDFLQEASDLLSDVDNKLVELEQHPDDTRLLNDIFRGFHTIKGGAGFLGATEMVALCHRTENLFDKLRQHTLTLDPAIMDVILEATAEVRHMMVSLASAAQPDAAPATLLAALDAVLEGGAPLPAAIAPAGTPTQFAGGPQAANHGPDWSALLAALAPPGRAPEHAEAAATTPVAAATPAEAPTPRAPAKAGVATAARDSTIRVDTDRLDQVLNLSGEIGLTKNRLNCLRAELLAGNTGPDTVNAMDAAISQLDLLVGDLQNAVMKTRMQPVGSLFQKYPRLVRDLARQLGKEVELEISGGDTELDKTIIEDLKDPLVHLVRNAVDHGVEMPAERIAAGKPAKSTVRLSAQQAGDHIVLEISDDGRGIRAEVLRRKALDKGLIDYETANSLDEASSLKLIFLPGFSTKDQISDVSGRGVGMDVVKTNIQKLNGRIDIHSQPGLGTTFSVHLPLTLAIMPVLVVKVQQQSFAVPLSMVREIMPLVPDSIQHVSGRATLVLRDEVLPVRSLAGMLNRPAGAAPFGVLMQTSARGSFVLGVDGFVGRDDVVIKPLADIKPKGVSGATLSGDGSVVLVLDIEAMLDEPGSVMLGYTFNRESASAGTPRPDALAA
ncbi:MAG: chemotaxis protein CheA [Rhodocyclaceae bacterium]|nr:chemotaxis protein CheA [Rhodocyclaceae bacterium]